ncbi:MAG: winged helix-turn-helix transcriptional regulator [Promethearchaeia archaeon]
MLISQFHKLYKKEGLSEKVISTFQDIIYGYYRQYGRDFPFREKIKPYYVLVSEMMLQQTQTSRVSEKFLNFIKKFPSFKDLATAPLPEVLRAWQGLGYNRRAKALKKIAQIIITDHDGELPSNFETLKSFPHIGKATASSIRVFAFNIPTPFIETNIRRVYLYFFFPGRTNVPDEQIYPIVEATLDKKNPRKWYYALMDYGVMLKKKHPNLNKKSAQYRKQKPFKGSNREIRGKLLKFFLKEPEATVNQLSRKLGAKKSRLKQILEDLLKEGFLKKTADGFCIKQE